MRIIFILIVSVLFFSCNGFFDKKEEDMSTDGEAVSTSNKNGEAEFSKTKFTDRAEELIYIRKYIEYRLPNVLIEENPKKMEEALEELVGTGKNVTLEEAVKYTWMYDGAYKRLWYLVTENNLSFSEVRRMLLSYDTLYPKGKQKAKEGVEILPVIDEEEKEVVEIPPVVEGKYNPDKRKIRGDFNGDGKYEYAYCVLAKQGHGNPVEDGVPDEYEIRFSDGNISPVNVGCCRLRLVNEGDLNNDGTDEFSIAQNPMNGCIGSFKTFTNRNNKCVALFPQFVFYNCNELSIEELKGFVIAENGIIYYREMDPDGGRLIKKKATVKN